MKSRIVERVRKILEEKITKMKADYMPDSDKSEKCMGCSKFVEPNSCTLVEGDIQSSGWCKYWEKE